MIREGTTARDLESLLPAVTPQNSSRCMFVTDDRHLTDLLTEGHINYAVRKAISLGLDPITAIQMATINPARYFGLKDKGGVGPGMRADLVVLDDLRNIQPKMVFRGGQLVAEEGRLLPQNEKRRDVRLRSSINVNWEKTGDLRVPARGHRARVIGVRPGQVMTDSLLEDIRIEGGYAVADISRDQLRLAVIERHLASGNVGLGFVRGFGLTRGALASSVAHDSHNLIVVGTNERDMLLAAKETERIRGGLSVVADGQVLASLPLPIAGLLSDAPFETVRQNLQEVLQAAQAVGSTLHDPFMTLSFLALPVIPSLKLTDKGLVDVTQFSIVPLFED